MSEAGKWQIADNGVQKQGNTFNSKAIEHKF